MVEMFLIGLTAVATLFAAISAWMSYRVSEGSLQFQKNYAKNQQLLTQLNSVISKLRTLKYFMANPLAISDEQFGTIEPLFVEVKMDLEKMQEIGIFDNESCEISKVGSFGEMIDKMPSDNAYITEVIHALESKINVIFK